MSLANLDAEYCTVTTVDALLGLFSQIRSEVDGKRSQNATFDSHDQIDNDHGIRGSRTSAQVIGPYYCVSIKFRF